MNKQFEDAFHANMVNTWDDKEKLKSIKFIGAYLLTEKEGVDLTQYKLPSGSEFFGNVSGEAFIKYVFFYQGYEKLDSLFNNCVTKFVDNYEYESNVEE